MRRLIEGGAYSGKRAALIRVSNGNRSEWSPIRSVIIRVKTKSDDRAAGVRFASHEITISEKRRRAKL